ncbi:DUF397 domain-containing protein [Actinophytocola sp.]|uniref:DUF397 domain-containing protein n=1 Tax=Actinophytocola sp. TaxID=1872138 RepID=UPI003D6BF6FC
MITPDLSRMVCRKSSYSTENGGACVEVGALPAGAAVRDSKNPDGGLLLLTSAAWNQFRATAKQYDNDEL